MTTPPILHELEYIVDSRTKHILMTCRPCRWRLQVAGMELQWLTYHWYLHRYGTQIPPAEAETA